MEAIVDQKRTGLDSEFTVTLFGPEHPSPLRSIATRYGAEDRRSYWVKAASDHTRPGFRQILTITETSRHLYDQEPDLYADGVLLVEPRSGIVMRSADCPVVVLFEISSGRLVVVHAGRPAMTPTNQPGEPVENIITAAYKVITQGLPVSLVHARVVGSICADHFSHEHPEATELVKPFWDNFGPIAITDTERGTLDLPGVIRHQLEGFGVSSKNIEQVGPCTYETPWLASYRRNVGTDKATDRNAIVVVRH